MSRSKFQVLVVPFVIKNGLIRYCIFKRMDMGIWQFIAGGGEDTETPLEAAKREAFEEANIDFRNTYYNLESICSISTEYFSDKHRISWGENCLVIPEYSFAVKLTNFNINISNEHTEYKWVDYNTAKELLRWDGNKTTLWELDNRIRKKLLQEA